MIFYLSVRHGDRIVRDEEGSDLPDLDAARSEAIDGAREMMSEAILAGADVSGRSFEIADENHEVVAEVPFRDAVRAV